MAKIDWKLQKLRFFQSGYRKGLFVGMSQKLYEEICYNIMNCQGQIYDSWQWLSHVNELQHRKNKYWHHIDNPQRIDNDVFNSLGELLLRFVFDRDNVARHQPLKYSMYTIDRNTLYCGKKVLARFINGVLLINSTMKDINSGILIRTLPKDAPYKIVEHLNNIEKSV